MDRSFFQSETRAFLSLPEIRERLPFEEPFLQRTALTAFFGRENEIAQVRAFLSSNGWSDRRPVSRVSIFGPQLGSEHSLCQAGRTDVFGAGLRARRNEEVQSDMKHQIARERLSKQCRIFEHSGNFCLNDAGRDPSKQTKRGAGCLRPVQ